MHRIILLLLLALMLSSCSVLTENQRIGELEKKIADLEGQNEKDFFNKNKECSEYKEKVKDEILAEPSVMGIDIVFYSPKANSCLYVLWKQPFIEKIGKYEQQYFLINLFTNELIDGYYSESKFAGDKEKFDQKVEDYKK